MVTGQVDTCIRLTGDPSLQFITYVKELNIQCWTKVVLEPW